MSTFWDFDVRYDGANWEIDDATGQVARTSGGSTWNFPIYSFPQTGKMYAEVLVPSTYVGATSS